MRSVLAKAGQGKLRCLDEQQLNRLSSLQARAIGMFFAIGLFFSAWPAAMENFLGYGLAVDGFKDAYWVCHTQSFLGNATFEPATPMDPDSFLCATVHVNASSCLDNAVLVDAVDDNTYYPPGVDASVDMSAIARDGWITIESGQFGALHTMSHICSQCECVVCGCAHHAQGELRLDSDNKLLLWWLMFTPVMLCFAFLEVTLLFYCAMRYTTQVAWVSLLRCIHTFGRNRAMYLTPQACSIHFTQSSTWVSCTGFALNFCSNARSGSRHPACASKRRASFCDQRSCPRCI